MGNVDEGADGSEQWCTGGQGAGDIGGARRVGVGDATQGARRSQYGRDAHGVSLSIPKWYILSLVRNDLEDSFVKKIS
jgi:hypothetical protein